MRESAKALAAYAAYRDLGPERSLDKVRQEYGKSTAYKRQLERWSAAHGWVARAAAHDRAIEEELAHRDREARIAQAELQRQNRLKTALGLRAKGVQALGLMTPEELAKRPGDVIRMLAHADMTERLDMGEATSRNEVAGKDDGPIETVIRFTRGPGNARTSSDDDYPDGRIAREDCSG